MRLHTIGGNVPPSTHLEDIEDARQSVNAAGSTDDGVTSINLGNAPSAIAANELLDLNQNLDPKLDALMGEDFSIRPEVASRLGFIRDNQRAMSSRARARRGVTLTPAQQMALDRRQMTQFAATSERALDDANSIDKQARFNRLAGFQDILAGNAEEAANSVINLYDTNEQINQANDSASQSKKNARNGLLASAGGIAIGAMLGGF